MCSKHGASGIGRGPLAATGSPVRMVWFTTRTVGGSTAISRATQSKRKTKIAAGKCAWLGYVCIKKWALGLPGWFERCPRWSLCVVRGVCARPRGFGGMGGARVIHRPTTRPSTILPPATTPKQVEGVGWICGIDREPAVGHFGPISISLSSLYFFIFIQKPFDTSLILFWNRAPRLPSERPRMIPVDSSLNYPCFWLFRTVSAGS